MSLYAKGNSHEKYEASPKQLDNLKDAWTAVAKKYNYRVEDSAVFNCALLNVAVYFPKWQEAGSDRRWAIQAEENKIRDARIAALESQKPTA